MRLRKDIIDLWTYPTNDGKRGCPRCGKTTYGWQIGSTPAKAEYRCGFRGCNSIWIWHRLRDRPRLVMEGVSCART